MHPDLFLGERDRGSAGPATKTQGRCGGGESGQVVMIRGALAGGCGQCSPPPCEGSGRVWCLCTERYSSKKRL
nr:MAG TPA: hypothetical protein [Caudoviricetes sp.]